MSPDITRALLTRWRVDAGGTYLAWFLCEERLKNLAIPLP